jgi:hypothetical protein
MDFDESLARLAASEASKTKDLLCQLEATLYNPVDENSSRTLQSEDGPYREYSRGYDAHVESVNAKEILMWQKGFKYIYVVGMGTSTFPLSENDTDDMPFVETESAPDSRSSESMYVDSINMKVVGSKIELNSGCNADVDEEILARDGNLEEYFAYDNSGSLLDSGLDNESIYDSIDPSKTGQAEVINGLLDAVFPDICAAMEPLVRRVVATGREHGVCFTDYSSAGATGGDYGDNEFGGGFFDSEDDEGDGMFVVQDAAW